ncbi:MAG: hypothetical protein ACM31C_20910 [Acidobacteriota bacterium]
MSLTPVAVAGITAGVLSTSLVLPIGLVFLVTAISVLGVLAVRTGVAPVREALAVYSVQRARYARRDARERLLSPTSFSRETLFELTRLVDDIERNDPPLAERFDLEALLDRFVMLTNGHERAMRAVGMASRVQLERMCESYRSDPGAHPQRLDIAERRLRSQLQCEARAELLADELAIVSDLIRLIAQRAACPDDPQPDEDIERDLAELDADEAARKLLAAEFH